LINLPELCKIIQTVKAPDSDLNTNDNDNDEDSAHASSGELDLEKLKLKLLGFISDKKELAEKLSDMLELKDSDSVKADKLRLIQNESMEIYNKLTLEIIRILKLMIDFGKYRLRMGEDEQETR
jgi:hypothetical protein